MLLRTLKSNRTGNLALFPIIGVLLWMNRLLHPRAFDFYRGENQNFLFSPLIKIFQASPFLLAVVGLILVVFAALLAQQVNDRFLLIRVRTKLPAPVYVLLASGFADLHTLHPVYPAAVFLLLAIYSFFTVFDNPNPKPGIFNAGFFIGVGSLFYFDLFVVIPAFLIGIFILCRGAGWREFVVLLVGFLVPFVLALGISFYSDRLLELLYVFEMNVLTHVNHFKNNIAMQGFLAVVIIIVLLASIKIIQQYDSSKVSTRKYYSFFLVLFIFTLAGIVVIPAVSNEMLIISFIPVTFLISNYFATMQSRFWSELIFMLLVGVVIFMQFSENIF